MKSTKYAITAYLGRQPLLGAGDVAGREAVKLDVRVREPCCGRAAASQPERMQVSRALRRKRRGQVRLVRTCFTSPTEFDHCDGGTEAGPRLPWHAPLIPSTAFHCKLGSSSPPLSQAVPVRSPGHSKSAFTPAHTKTPRPACCRHVRMLIWGARGISGRQATLPAHLS